MEPHEIQAKAIIAAALIHKDDVMDYSVAFQLDGRINDSLMLQRLRQNVDVIYSALTNPK